MSDNYRKLLDISKILKDWKFRDLTDDEALNKIREILTR